MPRRDIVRRRQDAEKQRRESEIADRRSVDLRVLERAAVEARKLTQKPDWDVYLQQVASLNTADQRALEALQNQADAAEYQTPEQAQRVAFQRALHRARIQARNECLEIPGRIQGAAQS